MSAETLRIISEAIDVSLLVKTRRGKKIFLQPNNSLLNRCVISEAVIDNTYISTRCKYLLLAYPRAYLKRLELWGPLY